MLHTETQLSGQTMMLRGNLGKGYAAAAASELRLTRDAASVDAAGNITVKKRNLNSEKTG